MLDDPEFIARVRSPEGAEFRAFLERDFRGLLAWAGRRIGWRDFEILHEVVDRTCRRLLDEGVLKQARGTLLSPYRSAEVCLDNCLEAVLRIAEAEFSAMLRADRFRRELALIPRELRDLQWAILRELPLDQRYLLIENEGLFKWAIARMRVPEQQVVARLRYIDGYDLASTVQITGQPANVVLRRLYQGSDTLVKLVAVHCGRSRAVNWHTGRWRLWQRWIWLRNVKGELRRPSHALRPGRPSVSSPS